MSGWNRRTSAVWSWRNRTTSFQQPSYLPRWSWNSRAIHTSVSNARIRRPGSSGSALHTNASPWRSAASWVSNGSSQHHPWPSVQDQVHNILVPRYKPDIHHSSCHPPSIFSSWELICSKYSFWSTNKPSTCLTMMITSIPNTSDNISVRINSMIT